MRGTYDLILANAKARSTAYSQIDRIIPSTFVAADYEELTRLLLLDKLDMKELGEEGLIYKRYAIQSSLYKLSEVPNGGPSLIRLLEDKRLPFRGDDAQTLCDAMLRRGEEMLPLLAGVSKRKEVARRCSYLIEEGRKTAF